MKISPDIPVILCTGYSKKISDETASEIGIKAFAYKPVVKADLAKTVRKVLDEAKLARGEEEWPSVSFLV
jgi:two-component system cell cycle sensor histidine kinase/response regulator CckA